MRFLSNLGDEEVGIFDINKKRRRRTWYIRAGTKYYLYKKNLSRNWICVNIDSIYNNLLYN